MPVCKAVLIEGEFWSEGSGGCVNGGVTGGSGFRPSSGQTWRSETYDCEPPAPRREELTPSALDKLAAILSPLPTDFIGVRGDLSPQQLQKWFAEQTLQQLLGKSVPFVAAHSKEAAIPAIVFQVARALYALRPEDPIGDWNGTPIAPHLSPEGIPQPR